MATVLGTASRKETVASGVSSQQDQILLIQLLCNSINRQRTGSLKSTAEMCLTDILLYITL